MHGAELCKGSEVCPISTNSIHGPNACSVERQHAHSLRVVPDIADVLGGFASIEPLLVRHLRLVTVQWVKVVELYRVLECVFNLFLLVLKIHDVDLINLSHELLEVNRRQLHHLLKDNLDILITCTDELLLGWATFLQTPV